MICKPPENISLLSFFVGGGFLDMGFEMAGFDVVWTNECEPAFIAGYEAGMTAWRQSQKNGRPATIACRSRIESTDKKKIEAQAFSHGRPEFWGIIGGPPCPDFSNAGKHRGRDGEHGKLSEVFVKRICDLSPDFFVFENVPGLLRTHRHREFFEELIAKLEKSPSKYICDYKTLNAIEFGVPQDRKRVFLIGVTPAVFERHSHQDPDLARAKREWFPWPKPKYPDALTVYEWPTTCTRGKTPRRPSGIPEEIMAGTYLDGANPPQNCQNGNETFHPYSERFHTVWEGDISHKSFKRLHRWRYSPTAAYGNNEVHLHPWIDRRLSVREALRLQSVPDEYVLPADMTLTAKFKMITNGVPVRLARSVALAMHDYLMINPIA